MAEQHTVKELQTMSDGELAELTARLRGNEPCFYCEKGFPLREGMHLPSQRLGMIGAKPCKFKDWNPAADISQAYGLLLWLREQRIATYQIHGLTINPSIWIWRLKDETGFAVFGVDARAMCYAFVLAMQEVSNGK